jgi:hypothetical protein
MGNEDEKSDRASRIKNAELTPEIRAEFERELREQAERELQRPQVHREGIAALTRLFEVAHGHSGQCRTVAAFLLGCYNGQRFPFDLSDFRAIDYKLFDDCIAVLKMDAQPKQEVHTYFPHGSSKFEQLAKDWGIADRSLS